VFWRSNVLAFTEGWWFFIFWILFFRSSLNQYKTWNLGQRIGQLSRKIICWPIVASVIWHLLLEMFEIAERHLKGRYCFKFFILRKKKQTKNNGIFFLSHRTSSRQQFHWVTTLWTGEEFLCIYHKERLLLGLKLKLYICLSYKPSRRLGDILGQWSSFSSVRECCSIIQQLIQISQTFVDQVK